MGLELNYDNLYETLPVLLPLLILALILLLIRVSTIRRHKQPKVPEWEELSFLLGPAPARYLGHRSGQAAPPGPGALGLTGNDIRFIHLRKSRDEYVIPLTTLLRVEIRPDWEGATNRRPALLIAYSDGLIADALAVQVSNPRQWGDTISETTGIPFYPSPQ